MSDPEETERDALAKLIYNDSYAIARDVEWEDQEDEFRGIVLCTIDLILNSGFRRLSESGGLDLDAISGRLDALSDFDGEEWQVWYSSATKEPVSVGPDNFTEQFRVDGMAEEDAVFVANAPQDVRELLAEVERLRLSESLRYFCVRCGERFSQLGDAHSPHSAALGTAPCPDPKEWVDPEPWRGYKTGVRRSDTTAAKSSESHVWSPRTEAEYAREADRG